MDENPLKNSPFFLLIVTNGFGRMTEYNLNMEANSTCSLFINFLNFGTFFCFFNRFTGGH